MPLRAFVLNNLVRSSLAHEILHLAASKLCEIDHFSQLTEVWDHREFLSCVNGLFSAQIQNQVGGVATRLFLFCICFVKNSYNLCIVFIKNG